MKRTPPTFRVTDRLAALAEPIRLRILRLLEGQELSVGEVAKVVQLPQSTVSRHLKVLLDGGWLSRRNSGTATLYRLVLDDLAVEARALWLAVRVQMGDGAEVLEDSRRLASVLAERRLDSSEFFGRVAGEWDSLRTSLFGAAFTGQALLALLGRGMTVADLGCGTGNVAEMLAPYVQRVIAVDSSGPMLGAARERLKGFKNIQFAEGRLEELPLKSGSVDAAVCLLVLHHVAEPAKALAEMRRALRPGGTALVVDMVEHTRAEYRQAMGHQHLGFSPEAIKSMFRAAGLSDVRIWDLPRDADAKGPGLFAATGRVGAASY